MVERWRVLTVVHRQSGEPMGRHTGNRPAPGRRAIDSGVVHKDRHSITGELHIGFDPLSPCIEGGVECPDAVLGGTPVEGVPTMGDGDRATWHSAGGLHRNQDHCERENQGAHDRWLEDHPSAARGSGPRLGQGSLARVALRSAVGTRRHTAPFSVESSSSSSGEARPPRPMPRCGAHWSSSPEHPMSPTPVPLDVLTPATAESPASLKSQT